MRPVIYEFGEFRLDPANHLLSRRDGTPVPLTSRVFDTLAFMVEHHGTVLDKERLMEAVWSDSIVEENNLAQSISKLRQVFGEKPGAHRFIVTVPGRGYRFAADVTILDGIAEGTQSSSGKLEAQPDQTATRLAEAASEPKVAPAWPFTRRAVIAALVIIAFGAAGVLLLWSRKEPPPSAIMAASAAALPQKSIAVLPFENLSDDKQNAYFAAGIQDDVLTSLAQIHELTVISHTSVMAYRRGAHNTREIGQALGVANVLEGSVRRAGNRVLVNVQLIDIRNDRLLWAERYNRAVADAVGLQGELATQIAAALKATLAPGEKARLETRPTASLEAYELYLQGRYFFAKRTGDDLKKAIESYNQALTKDPNYALAYAGIADAYVILPEYAGVSTNEAFAKAHAAAEKALALDNDLAEAHASLGLVLALGEFNCKAARRELERAIELKPNYAAAHYTLGLTVLGPLGEFDAAITEMKRAVELDPLSMIMTGNLAYCYNFARRYPEAILAARKGIELDPKSPMPQDMLGLGLELSGYLAEAVTQYEKSFQVAGGDYHVLCFLSHLYGVRGERAKALENFQKARELEQSQGVEWAYGYALVAIVLGDNEQAIHWLERSYQARETPSFWYIRGDPLLDPLRGDPRFEKLANRMLPSDAM